MKKLLLLTLITLNSIAYSQVTAYHMVYVKSVDQAKFETVEKEYMSKMAQNAVNKGKFDYWSLEKFIHPMVPIGGKLNSALVGNWYQFVIVYPDVKSHLNAGTWWSGAEEELGISEELLS